MAKGKRQKAKLKIEILTLFPEMFGSPFAASMVKRAQEKGLVEIKVHNLRDWAKDERGTVDDRPFGGGPGMMMMLEPVDNAVASLSGKETRVILLDPAGNKFDQKTARRLSTEEHLVFLCGHYEGVDERVKENLVDETISIGDYVLTGGELPAMVVVDSLVRLIPGVLGKDESPIEESFSGALLEYPQYTRPEDYRGWRVPKILLSGDHEKIKKWREQKAHEKTKKFRPDLLKT